MQQYRQGDVLLVSCARVPKRAKQLARDEGRVVLAYGEVTGHAHAFRSPHVTLFADGVGRRERRYLRVTAPAMLRHEEHGGIRVPAGDYRVVQQREFSENQQVLVGD